ncbi:hypothetical protein [Gluconobacter potus]|uniref:hypothetical protein n=1 Tax=Gluconobacter potus TaxID=2724927 RepID=UPI0039EA558C
MRKLNSIPVPKSYSRKRQPGSFTRVIAEMPNEEIEAVDNWGAEFGASSRTAAIRQLLKAGLESKKAAGSVAKLSPAASTTPF